MVPPSDCPENSDPLRLVREGTSQDQRFPPALDPANAPVDSRKPANAIVFAAAYSAFVKYYDSNNVAVDNWKRFFDEDMSVKVAIAAVQNVDQYRLRAKACFDYLNNSENKDNDQELKNNLGCLFSCVGTLARQLDVLKEGLPNDIALKGALQNLIQTRLATALNRLITYYKAGVELSMIADTVPSPELHVLGSPVAAFHSAATENLSKDWITDGSPDWAIYYGRVPMDDSVYGALPSVFEKINHIATHNLFTSIFDEFLKAYARTAIDAESALQKTFTAWDLHEPHYALFLAFLHLFEHVRTEINTLTARHLDFYYKTILQLKEKPAEPGSAHLLVELTKQAAAHEIKTGELFKAGKDHKGLDAFFANDRDFVANKARVTALKTLYRHGEEAVHKSTFPEMHNGRFFASPIANSADGLGAELTTVDKSWHPFFNKVYEDSALSEIKMPKAEIGFAIASHYLLMAGGTRTITLIFRGTGVLSLHAQDLVCKLTSEKDWIEGKPVFPNGKEAEENTLTFRLDGSDPAVAPYSSKIHGHSLQTNLPVLLITLRQAEDVRYIYKDVDDFKIDEIELRVVVTGLKTLAVSNDFGPVDTSKPFQPFGSQPVEGSSFTVGSQETFRKNLDSASLHLEWQKPPTYYSSGAVGVTKVDPPQVNISFLQSGEWSEKVRGHSLTDVSDFALGDAGATIVESAQVSGEEIYGVSSRTGYVRLVLTGDLGFQQYQKDLANFLAKRTPRPLSHPGQAILGPFATEVAMNYTASKVLHLDDTDEVAFKERTGRFYHIAPFGQAEQHPYLKINAPDKRICLFPQLKHEAEFYIGLTDIVPPQNLSLLFQVVDGSADPRADKPDPHIHWSYLRQNEWIPFSTNEVEDQTDGLLNSGIVTFAIPRDASNANTILPQNMYWIRAAVESESRAVCRLMKVAAQAFKVTFKDMGNDPGFPAKVLVAGTIDKLDQPDANVKTVSQPFASFGGRGKELPSAFYTRTSERLRHKDRAIALWDYERLVLEAFPQIFKVKCLNHTHYEPDGYSELAPGHVTVVTIPNRQFQNLQDPLRPFTSLGLLQEIENFLKKRVSCFVNLHVKNPQFEEVRVDFRVRLKKGFDETFYTNKLKEDITRFLSPWAFSGSGTPSFGGKIYKSVLIDFVEDQRCVDYVTDFHLHRIDGVMDSVDLSEIEGSKAVSILVSVPAKRHEIFAIRSEDVETSMENCLCEE
jgi:hypothetical protein